MLRLLTIIGFAFFIVAAAEPEAPAGETDPTTIAQSLHYKTGRIDIGHDLAEILVADGFRYLGAVDTETFLTKLWGNPPGSGADSLGLIVPLDPDPLSEHGWAAIISYDPSGHVTDDDASKINYGDLLKEMQTDAEASNPGRIEAGYDPITIVGWARPPFYDATTKKLHWAERLKFGDSPDDTLNYRIRALGREGVLEVNIIAPIADLDLIDQNSSAILSMVQFKQGNTYAEFDPKIDKMAGYGIAGLIAGGALVKTGLFKGLIAALIAGKKFILIGLVALAGFFGSIFKRVKGLFGGKKQEAEAVPVPQAAEAPVLAGPETSVLPANDPEHGDQKPV